MTLLTSNKLSGILGGMEVSPDNPRMCDHTSVGMLVFRDGKLLLIDRKKFPFGYAQPAGHVDEFADFEEAARTELLEETGLTATSLKLLREERRENACRRPEGAWHYWKMYRVEAEGEINTSDDEVKGFFWCTQDEMRDLVVGKGEKQLADVTRDWFNDLDLANIWDRI